jgi:lipopolysaccharide export system permease protein
VTLITRYLFREYMKAATACVAVAVLLFLSVDFVERADEFLRHHATALEIARYYLYRFPVVFIQVSPVAVLLAVLIVVSVRSRSNEITAIFSSGASLARVVAPLLAGCALVSALSLGTSEALAPVANRRAREIAQVRVRPGKLSAQFSSNRYWVRSGNAILSAQVVDPPSRSLSGFDYLEIDGDSFRLLRRIEARKAVYGRNGRWILDDGKERTFDDGLQPVSFARKEFALPDSIQAFVEGETPPQEMTYAQLSDYTRDARGKGYDVGRYEVDLHAKISYPLLNVIVGLLAIPFAMRSPRSGGVWRSVGMGLMIGFLCWVVLSASLALGRKGLLPPAAAAWLPDALFAGIGGLLFTKLRR